jgi:hypothetical protein
LTVIRAWSIAINADVELVGLWTMSDKVWLPGWRPSYSANKVVPDVEGEIEEFVTPSRWRSYVMFPSAIPDSWMPFPVQGGGTHMKTGGNKKKVVQRRTPPLNGKCSTIHGRNMKTGTVSLLTGERRAGGDGKAWVPALEKVGYWECIAKGEVGEDGGGVIDEEAVGVGHETWEEKRGEGRRRGGGGRGKVVETWRVNMSRTHGVESPDLKRSKQRMDIVK